MRGNTIFNQKRKLIAEKQAILMKIVECNKEEEELEVLLESKNKELKEFNKIAKRALEKIKGNDILTTIFLGQLEGLNLREIAERDGLSYNYIREKNIQLKRLLNGIDYSQ